MKRTKDVFIGEYKYGILIENVPYNMKQDELVRFVSRKIANELNQIVYTMCDIKYVANPTIVPYDLFEKGQKEVIAESINFIIDFANGEIRRYE